MIEVKVDKEPSFVCKALGRFFTDIGNESDTEIDSEVNPTPPGDDYPSLETVPGQAIVNPTHAGDTPSPIIGAVDKDGLPWDERIHSGNQSFTADGRWRVMRRPVKLFPTAELWDDHIKSVREEYAGDFVQGAEIENENPVPEHEPEPDPAKVFAKDDTPEVPKDYSFAECVMKYSLTFPAPDDKKSLGLPILNKFGVADLDKLVTADQVILNAIYNELITYANS